MKITLGTRSQIQFGNAVMETPVSSLYCYATPSFTSKFQNRILERGHRSRFRNNSLNGKTPQIKKPAQGGLHEALDYFQNAGNPMKGGTTTLQKQARSYDCIDSYNKNLQNMPFSLTHKTILFSIHESRTENIKMQLKPQDILTLLKLNSIGPKNWSYNRLALELFMSPAEVHASIKRSLAARLALRKDEKVIPFIKNVEEFIIHGLKYVFIPEHGSMVRGMPTSHATAPLKANFIANSEPPPVWSDPEGESRGLTFTPLYQSAPKAAKNDPTLYELLVLIDVIRSGQTREREWAIKEFKARLKHYG